MTLESSCPVCERQGLLPDCERCPQCDADLTCFQALDILSAGSASSGTEVRIEQERPHRFLGIGMFVLFFIIAMAFVMLSLCMRNFDRRLGLVELNRAVSTASRSNGWQQNVSARLLALNAIQTESVDGLRQVDKVMTTISAEIDRLASRLKVLDEGFDKRIATFLSKEAQEAMVTDSTFFYHVQKTDTLWSIACRFYGDGIYYPVIMEQNPHLIISNLNYKNKVRLFCDPDTAAGIYKEKTEWKNGTLLWKHDVQSGETRQSIFARFATPGDTGQVFFDDNPMISPNNMVRIILH